MYKKLIDPTQSHRKNVSTSPLKSNRSEDDGERNDLANGLKKECLGYLFYWIGKDACL